MTLSAQQPVQPVYQRRPPVMPRSGAADRLAPDRPKRVVNLAAMASNVLRSRDTPQRHTVRYIAQVDLDGVMVRRSKVGVRAPMYVVLEGTVLTVLKNRTAPPRHEVNVRVTPIAVDVDRKELHVYLPGNVQGKNRLLRLHISSVEESGRWKVALEAAVNSDITDYYTFGRSLGSGAYGDVVQAVDVRSKEVRAVKIIKRGYTAKSREHLDAEIQAMQSISHPNIVKTYQIFDLKRTIYIVMEYVPGGDLFDFVAQHNCLTETQASQIMKSVFDAVEYLHGNSIVHRDLKPENILCVNSSWPLHIKITDFGFASFLDPHSDSDNTMRSQVGTAYFMAPEIITSQGHGPAVDLWACGVILYTILTGRLPFPGKNTTEYFNNVLKGRPLFPPILWKGISSDAMSLVKGLLNLDPKKRLTSLAALQHRWIAVPAANANSIRRDRSNLHSRRRRLFKARKAIIAVAMANKFKATIPQVVDKVGDGTKKVAKKTGESVKKVGDDIGEGTKKMADGVGEGTKKMASGIATGSKKVAGGIGTGVKKTVGGVETSAKKVGEGVKKTAGGIETGFKKTGEGFKKTGGGIKRGVEKVRMDRDKTKASDSEAGGTKASPRSQSESTRESAKKRSPFKRKGQNSKSLALTVLEALKEADQPTSVIDVPQQTPGATPLETDTSDSRKDTRVSREVLPASKLDPLMSNRDIPTAGLGTVVGKFGNVSSNLLTRKYSSSDYFSAQEELGTVEEGWEDVEGEGLDISTVGISSHRPSVQVYKVQTEHEHLGGLPIANRRPSNDEQSVKQVSNVSSSSVEYARPKLDLLKGLTMGLSDTCMAGGSSRESPLLPNGSAGGGAANSLRMTAALLLASNTSSFGLEGRECKND